MSCALDSRFFSQLVLSFGYIFVYILKLH